MKEIVITSSVLIVCIVLIRHFFRGKISSRLQYALWLLVAVRLMIPVSAQISLFLGELDGLRVMDLVKSMEESFGSVTDRLDRPVQFTADMDSWLGRQMAEAVIREEMPELYTEDGATSVFLAGKTGITWLAILRFLWFGGTGVMAVWMIGVNVRFGHRLHRGRRRLAMPEGTETKVPVYTAGQLVSPCLYGFPGREAIYVPEGMAEDAGRLRHILTHEMCHRRHGDSLWSILRNVLLAVYWFHPLVWVAAVLSKRDCELACDEGALAVLGEQERIDYGKTLLSIIGGRGALSDLACTATTMTGSGKSIKERIRCIAERPRVLGAAVAAVLVLAAIVSVAVFTKSPQFSGKTWSGGTIYVMTGDKRIMLPDSIAGISGYQEEEGDDNDLVIYQIASNREVGRFCTVSYEDAAALVDAGREVVPLGSYGMNIPLRKYMGEEIHIYIPEMSKTGQTGGAGRENGGTVPRQSAKAPFAFDGRTEWLEEEPNGSVKAPFAFDGKAEWGNELQPEQVTEGLPEGVPGTDSNEETTYMIEDDPADYQPGEQTTETGLLPEEQAAETEQLPEEQIIETEIPSDEGVCYIYVRADYSGLKERYLEEMQYIDRALKAACSQVIVTDINRDITEKTFQELAEHRTLYLGDNAAVVALVSALPQPAGLAYKGTVLKTGEETEKTLQIRYRSAEGGMDPGSADRDSMFFDAVMLFATIANLEQCSFVAEDAEDAILYEIVYERQDTAARAGAEELWRDLEGEELQTWLEELYQRVIIELNEQS